jgi:hypothetical protein
MDISESWILCKYFRATIVGIFLQGKTERTEQMACPCVMDQIRIASCFHQFLICAAEAIILIASSS